MGDRRQEARCPSKSNSDHALWLDGHVGMRYAIHSFRIIGPLISGLANFEIDLTRIRHRDHWSAFRDFPEDTQIVP